MFCWLVSGHLSRLTERQGFERGFTDLKSAAYISAPKGLGFTMVKDNTIVEKRAMNTTITIAKFLR